MSVDGDCAFLRFQGAVEQGEQGGLTGTRTAHDSQQLSADERKAHVVHAVVAVRETEVDVVAAERHGVFDSFVLAPVLVCPDDGRVIDGLRIGTLQHAALLPYLVGAGQHRYVVQENDVGL